MLTKQEILDKMKRVKTWRELGLTVQQIYDVFADGTETASPVHDDQSETVAELHQTIDNLRESVRKLRAENKKLKTER